MGYEFDLPPELKERRPFILAHRGCRAQAPENSFAAFELALDQGAEAIETDLRITKDRVIVCIHDETVDRTTDGTGRVDQMTWAEIQALRLLCRDPAPYPEERVPALSEVLDALAERTYLALELKAPNFTRPDDVDLLLRTLADHDVLERVILLSFEEKALRCVEAAGAPIPLGHITILKPWPSTRYPLVGPWWPLLLLNPFYVAISHWRGQICCPLDPCPDRRIPLYLFLGVDALLSDDPASTRQVLDRWK